MNWLQDTAHITKEKIQIQNKIWYKTEGQHEWPSNNNTMVEWAESQTKLNYTQQRGM